MTTINERGLALIKSFEGFRSHAYQDSVGVWTIGWGHTKGVKPGMVISETTGEAMLRNDLEAAEAAVERLVVVPISSNQFAALVSFTFNLGEGNLRNSTLLKKLNKMDYRGAAAEFVKWTHAGGVELLGLVKRRRAERELFEAE